MAIFLTLVQPLIWSEKLFYCVLFNGEPVVVSIFEIWPSTAVFLFPMYRVDQLGPKSLSLIIMEMFFIYCILNSESPLREHVYAVLCFYSNEYCKMYLSGLIFIYLLYRYCVRVQEEL